MTSHIKIFHADYPHGLLIENASRKPRSAANINDTKKNMEKNHADISRDFKPF